MANCGCIKKRPCKICRKWYLPDRRTVKTQKTCGKKECRDKWHAKKCAEWNKKHRSYFQANQVHEKLHACSQQHSSPEPSAFSVSKRTNPPQLPQKAIQEVIGIQHSLIIEYVYQLLTETIQEVMQEQRAEFSGLLEQVPPSSRSRGDSRSRPP